MNPDIESLPLRDIHLPEAVSWWPPAPGWWLVLAVLCMGLVGVYFYYRRKRKYRLRDETLNLFHDIVTHHQQHANPVRTIKELSELLRRVSITLFPRQEAASLTGRSWLEFLDRVFVETDQPQQQFNTPVGEQLISVHYRETVDPNDLRVDQLFEVCEKWIYALPLVDQPYLSSSTKKGGKP